MTDHRYMRFGLSTRGQSFNESLPDIIGAMNGKSVVTAGGNNPYGAFSQSIIVQSGGFNWSSIHKGGGEDSIEIKFKASNDNSIYNGTEVIPRSQVFLAIIKY